MEKILKTLKSVIQKPPSSGRFLVTRWDGGEWELSKFSQELALETIAVTPDQAKARKCSQFSSISAFSGDFLRDVEGSHAQFSLVLVLGIDMVEHPYVPQSYDWRHVLESAIYLKANGVMAFVVHRNRLAENPRWLAAFVRGYKNINIWEYGENEILVTAEKRGSYGKVDPEQMRTLADLVRSGELCPPPERKVHTLPNAEATSRTFFRSKLFDPQVMLAFAKKLPWGEKKLKDLLNGWDVPDIHPIMPLRASHLATAISAGVMGSIVLKSPKTGNRVVMRGRTLRRIRVLKSASESSTWEKEDNEEKELEIGDFTMNISMLDLEDCKVHTVDPMVPAQLETFLEEWAEPLATKANESYPVVYDPLKYPYWEIFEPHITEVIDAPLYGEGIIQMTDTEQPELTTLQKHYVAGVIMAMLGEAGLTKDAKNSSSFSTPNGIKEFMISGEPSVGKTMMVARIFLALMRERAVKKGLKIGSPGWPISLVVTTLVNVPNVVEEFKKAAPLFQTRVIKNYPSMLAALDEAKHCPQPILMVIARSKLRRFPSIAPAYKVGIPPVRMSQSEEEVPHVICTSCGSEIDTTKYNWSLALLTNGPISSRGEKCPTCLAPMWQEIGLGRSIAFELRRELKKRRLPLLLACFDEIHQDKGATNQGQSMGWLSEIAEYSLGVSGTLYPGSADKVFYMLFRLMRSFRKEWKYREDSLFAQRYGYFRKVRKAAENNWRRTWLPGVSPEMVAGQFLSNSIFITLEDTGLPLPAMREIPVEVSLDKDELGGMLALIHDFKASLEVEGDALDKRYSAPSKGMAWLRLAPVGFHRIELARFSPAWSCPECGKNKLAEVPCQHYWHVAEKLPEDLTDEELGSLVRPVLDEDWRGSSEKVLLKRLRDEKNEGRPMLIYVYHSGVYEIQKRLAMVLKKAGFKVLDVSNIKTEKLVAVINNAPLQGYDAVICNYARVATGANLQGIASGFWYQPIWSGLKLFQGGRRFLRATSMFDEVRIFYKVTMQTPEMVILARAIESMLASLMVGGIDAASMMDVMDSVDHTESFTETMIKFVKGFIPNNTVGMLKKVEDLEKERRVTLRTAKPRKSTKNKKLIHPVRSSSGTQLSLFGKTAGAK